MKYYVYLHKRLDTNEIFYVGMSGKKNYKRAKNSYNRSKQWKEITNEVKWEYIIFAEFESKQEALQEEERMICFYGLIIDGNGPLVNRRIGDKIHEKQKEGYMKKVYQYSLEGLFLKEWKSVTYAASVLGVGFADIALVAQADKASRKKHTCGGFQWRYFKVDLIPAYSANQNFIENSKPILQYTKDGVFVREWKGSRAPSEELGLNRTAIRNVLAGISKTSGGYIWKHKQ